MFELDHVAVQVKDIAGAVKYYTETFGATVLYADQTWAFLRIGQGKLALVKPEQHPAHVALRVDEAALEATAKKTGEGDRYPSGWDEGDLCGRPRGERGGADLLSAGGDPLRYETGSGEMNRPE